ncbi:MAG TPA: sulfatase [Chitinophagaceae bacterium]|nr:sulfatase [Chitinophagaceae bacterium]
MKWIFILCLIASQVCAQTRRPNILVIFSDDHTQQTISAYGSRLMQTPGIDRIAKEGAILRNSFVTNSLCAPSRAVFLTGKYGHMNGLIDNSPGRRFDGSQQQLQKILGQNGYQTAWIGKWHLQTLPQGFDFWRVLPDQGNYFQPDFINMNNDTTRYTGYVSNLISDFSLEWLKKRDTSKPFFLVVGEKATHREWLPDIRDLGAFDDEDFPLPRNLFDKYEGRTAAMKQDMTIDKTMRLYEDLKIGVDYNKRGMYGRMSPEEKAAYKKYYDKAGEEYEKVKNDSVALVKWKFQRYMRDYLSTAKGMDRNISRILDELDAMGLKENTIVIYTSDQGFYMGEHGWFDKRFMYEESFRTPFVIRYPGHIKPGTSVDDMIINIDYAPSLLSMAGIKVPEDMQGSNFAPLLEKPGSVKTWRDVVYYHYYEYPEPHRVARHFGIRTSRYKLIRFYYPDQAWELYDLENDKMEMKNLINDPKYKKIAETLKQQLKETAAHFKDQQALTLMEGK